MGASTSTRARRASSDVTQSRRRAQLRSASGTFLKTENHLLTPWHPSTPVTSRSGSPRTPRSSFLKIPENEYVIDNSNPEGGRAQRANSRSFLGKLIRRKRASSSFGSTSTLEGADPEEGLGDTLDRAPRQVTAQASEPNGSSDKSETRLPGGEDDRASVEDEDVDDVFFEVFPRPRLASAESSCSDAGEEPVGRDKRIAKKHRSETLVYQAAVEEKAVQTEQVGPPDGRAVGTTCDHCKRRCLCYRNDSYDSNSSTQSLKIYPDEKSHRRRKRWSPLIRKRQMLLKQTAYSGTPSPGANPHDRAPQSVQMRRPQFQSPHESPFQSHPSTSQKRWHIPYRQKRRPQRTFSEDRADDVDSLFRSECVNASSDPSLCPQKTAPTPDNHPPSDHIRRARLYTLCLQKAKIPLAKSTSCSPTVPLRRQTWSEKCRPQRPQCEGQKKTKKFLHLLRNLRSSCSETDISMDHRPSVDSNGYVDPFYITRNFNRLNLKRLSLSHPNLNTGLRGSTTPPSGFKGRVSAVVGRLERALIGRGSIDRTYSLESQQSTSTGCNSDLPGSPTDSEATAHVYSKHQYGPDAENDYITFDPEMNPPMPRPRRLLSSSCSSAPSSPGFQDGVGARFSDVLAASDWEKEGIYESLDNYSPKRRSSTLKSLPSSEGETPPEVPPRPPSHRLRYRERMLRRQMPLPPIPITQSAGNIEDGAVEITTTTSAGNIGSALQSLHKTTCRRNNFVFRQSSSCSTLPSFQMDSSEEDSVFEAQLGHTSGVNTQPGPATGDAGVCTATRNGDDTFDTNCNHKHQPDLSEKPLHVR